MKRWWLIMALMLSVGVNLGIVVARLLPSDDGPEPVPLEGPGPEGPPPGPPLERPLEGLPPGGPEEPRVPPAVRRFAEDIGLSAEDRDKFVELHRAFLVETIQGRRRVMRLQEELRRKAFADDVDREAVDELLEELGAAHAALESAFIHNLLDVREILNPEQERRYRLFLRQLRERVGDPRQENWRPEGRFPRRNAPGAWRPGARPRGDVGPGGPPDRRRPAGERPPGPPGERPPDPPPPDRQGLR